MGGPTKDKGKKNPEDKEGGNSDLSENEKALKALAQELGEGSKTHGEDDTAGAGKQNGGLDKSNTKSAACGSLSDLGPIPKRSRRDCYDDEEMDYDYNSPMWRREEEYYVPPSYRRGRARSWSHPRRWGPYDEEEDYGEDQWTYDDLDYWPEDEDYDEETDQDGGPVSRPVTKRKMVVHALPKKLRACRFTFSMATSFLGFISQKVLQACKMG